MSAARMDGLFKVCVKLYAPEPEGIGSDAEAFVPVFHEWIQNGSLENLLLFDVADYAHAPDSPGIVLVAHEAHFALDRSDGRFGLLVQRRARADGSPADVIATTLLHALDAAGKLERHPSLAGKLHFDAANPRIEANDRLRAPNSGEGYAAFLPAVREATERVYAGRDFSIARIQNDPRDRLSVAVAVG